MGATSIRGDNVDTSATALRMLPGAALAVGCFIGSMLLRGGHVVSIMHVSSLMIVLAGIAAAGIMGFPFMVNAPTRILRLDACAKGAIFAGVIGNALGVLQVMNNLSTPELIGPGIATSFLSTLYGLGVWGICKATLHRRVQAMQRNCSDQIHTLETNELALVGFVGLLCLMLSVFVVLYATLNSNHNRTGHPQSDAPTEVIRGALARYAMDAKPPVQRHRSGRSLVEAQDLPGRSQYRP